jgi:hypothetical protein
MDRKNTGAGEPRLSMYGNCNARGGSRPNSGPKPHKGFRELINSELELAKEPGNVQRRGKPRDQPMATDDQVMAALYLCDGDVTKAADALGYSSQGLRDRIRAVPTLKRQMDEVLERAVDVAMSVLWEAMHSEHIGIRLSAAKEFLRTDAARRRGFSQREGNLSVNVHSMQVPNAVVWLDDEEPEPKDDPKLIEDEKVRH